MAAKKKGKDIAVDKGGRPSKYNDTIPETIYKLCLLGATDEEMASILSINTDTFYEWKKKYPKFSEALMNGKLLADANVAKSMYQRACGYEHKEDKIFNNSGEPLIVPTVKHYPPDTGAGTLWLKNRHPDKWRDKIEHDHTTGGDKINTHIYLPDNGRNNT